jgi:hypothetical protein
MTNVLHLIAPERSVELPEEVEEQLRDFIAARKEDYLEEPTFVEFWWKKNLRTLELKVIHQNWWKELRDTCKDDDECARTYEDDIIDELIGLIDERDDRVEYDLWKIVTDVLPGILADHAIAVAPLYGDLSSQYCHFLRQRFQGLNLDELQQAMVEWIELDDGNVLWEIGINGVYRDCEQADYGVPVEWVLDRLEDCSDVIGIEWNAPHIPLKAESTYADAVRFARERFREDAKAEWMIRRPEKDGCEVGLYSEGSKAVMMLKECKIGRVFRKLQKALTTTMLPVEDNTCANPTMRRGYIAEFMYMGSDNGYHDFKHCATRNYVSLSVSGDDVCICRSDRPFKRGEFGSLTEEEEEAYASSDYQEA